MPSPARRLLIAAMLLNAALATLKAVVGHVAGSGALVADAAHSAADMLAAGTIYLGLRLAHRPPDECHPYGHGKIEQLISLGIGVLLILVGFEVARDNLHVLWRGRSPAPAQTALWVAAACLIAKETLFRRMLATGKRLSSPALVADAWHQRSDALLSTGALLGVAGARAGYPALDPLAGCLLGLVLSGTGASLAYRAACQLTDRQDRHLAEAVRQASRMAPGVTQVRQVRIRRYGSKAFVDLIIDVTGNLTVDEGHRVAEMVRQRVIDDLPQVQEVLVHVDPHRASNDQTPEASLPQG